MRKLMWFTIGFAVACGLCAYIPSDDWTLPVLFGLCMTLAIASVVGIRLKTVKRAALALLGAAAALIWFLLFQRYYLLPAVSLDGVTMETTVIATDYGYDTGYGTGMDGIVEIEGKRYHVRVYINEDKQIEPGDAVSGAFRFRITTVQGQEGATYHSGNGTFLLGYHTGVVKIVNAVESGIEYYASILRGQIIMLLKRCFPEDVSAFTRALLLGDSSDLSYETDTAFKISGIRHIIAVSGLHVTILFSLLRFITFKKRFLTAVAAFPVLFLFAAVAGFTASVTRACIMIGLMILAQLFRKEYDAPTALAFACLVMLMCNPLVITSIGFQLSVGCVAGILLFGEPVKGWLSGLFPNIRNKPLALLVKWFTSSVSVTLGAMSLTTPLSAYYFGAVSLVGIVTNLVTLWVVNFVFSGIMIVCMVSLLSVNAAAFLGSVLAWPIRYVLATAKTLASLPLAAVYTKSIYISLWLVFVYILLLVFLLSKKRRPAILGCCAAIGLCAALLMSWLEPLMDACRVTVLDVGQGQSILLQSEGRTYLVDCGGDHDETTADTVAETLLSQGITRLDGIIVTHGDRDHAGGLPYLLTRVETDFVMMPVMVEKSLETTVRTLTGGNVMLVADDDLRITYGGVSMTIYGPTFVSESNENSLCVLFCTEKCDILITGDRSDFGERALLRHRQLPDVELLIAGHHGSKYSTSEELLRAVQPETVIISVGADNPYGHPAGEVLERLEEFGCEVYRTDEDGTVIYRR